MTFRPICQHRLAKPGHCVRPHGDREAFRRALRDHHKRGPARAATSGAAAVAFIAPVSIVHLDNAAESEITVALDHRLHLSSNTVLYDTPSCRRNASAEMPFLF